MEDSAYSRATASDGKLLSQESFDKLPKMYDDTREVVEQMYGMIWYLAQELADMRGSYLYPPNVKAYVKEAEENYQLGLIASPGIEQV